MSLFSPTDLLEINGFRSPNFNKPVYKYTSSCSFLKIIDNLTLQFSVPDTFEDKEELLIKRLDPTITQEDYARIFNEYLKPKDINQKPIATWEEAIAALPIEKFQEVHEFLYKIIRKTALIFCSTQNQNSNEMWNEFAEKETGVCFSFLLKPDFHFDHGVVVSKHVKYSDTITSFKQYPLNKEDQCLAIYNWVFSKKNKYKFEDEIRTYIYRDINKIVDIDRQYSYISISPKEILEIYFGSQCSESSIEEILNMLKSRDCRAIKYKMVKVGSDYIPIYIP